MSSGKYQMVCNRGESGLELTPVEESFHCSRLGTCQTLDCSVDQGLAQVKGVKWSIKRGQLTIQGKDLLVRPGGLATSHEGSPAGEGELSLWVRTGERSVLSDHRPQACDGRGCDLMSWISHSEGKQRVARVTAGNATRPGFGRGCCGSPLTDWCQ